MRRGGTKRTASAARREHGNSHNEVLLEKSGAGLAVLPPLEIWNPLESNSGKRCIRRYDGKGDLSQKELWSELGTKLLREITLGEQGQLQSLFLLTFSLDFCSV